MLFCHRFQVAGGVLPLPGAARSGLGMIRRANFRSVYFTVQIRLTGTRPLRIRNVMTRFPPGKVARGKEDFVRGFGQVVELVRLAGGRGRAYAEALLRMLVEDSDKDVDRMRRVIRRLPRCRSRPLGLRPSKERARVPCAFKGCGAEAEGEVVWADPPTWMTVCAGHSNLFRPVGIVFHGLSCGGRSAGEGGCP